MKRGYCSEQLIKHRFRVRMDPEGDVIQPIERKQRAKGQLQAVENGT